MSSWTESIAFCVQVVYSAALPHGSMQPWWQHAMLHFFFSVIYLLSLANIFSHYEVNSRRYADDTFLSLIMELFAIGP